MCVDIIQQNRRHALVTKILFSSRTALGLSKRLRIRWAASRLPWAAQAIFVKSFSVRRIVSRSAAYRSELCLSCIFVQNNSAKVKPCWWPPERRCEKQTEFSSRNEKARDVVFVTSKTTERFSVRKSLRCPLEAHICHGSACGVVWEIFTKSVCNESNSAKRNKYVNFFENVLTIVLLWEYNKGVITLKKYGGSKNEQTNPISRFA